MPAVPPGAAGAIFTLLMLILPITPEQASKSAFQVSLPKRNAKARAILVLRMLRGAYHWCDGYERTLDACFEMGDGEIVVRHLLAFADSNPELLNLLATHRNIGTTCLQSWRKRYPDLQLSLF